MARVTRFRLLVVAQLGVSKQATNDIVRELEHRGYIQLERDPSAGRARIVRYTERGGQFYDSVRIRRWERRREDREADHEQADDDGHEG